MRKSVSLLVVLAVLLFAVFPAFAQERPNIPELLTNDPDGRFTTLLTAVELAGLGDVLAGEGPFTVLAPTNDAFTATLEALNLTVEDVAGNPELLTAILTYHVIPERIFFRDLIRGLTAATVQGENIVFAEGDGGRLNANDVTILDVDNVASNGIVHVVEGVLVPPSILGPLTRPNLPAVLSSNGNFSSLVAAVSAAGLVDALSGEGPFTVLAPTDAAFAEALAYLDVTAEELFANTELLTQVLTYHVIPARLGRSDLQGEIATLQGENVTFEGSGPDRTVNGVEIAGGLGGASNGVFYTINSVLLPPSIAEVVTANRAHIRLAHLSPDAGAVDVYINDALVASGVTFGTVSGWLDVPAGAKNIAIVAAGETPENARIRRVEPGSWVTIAALGTAGAGRLRIDFLTEDYSPLGENQARVTVFHALESAPAIDVLANGSALIVNLAYPGFYGTNDGLDIRTVGNATYNLAVVPTGATTPELLTATLSAQSGVNYFIAATGTLANPSLVVSATNVAEVTGN
ncbi:MAG: fasciclin domain-containing protein [bacterium]|nr:fasciclin domain-containing protein [bacterium]